MMLEMQSSIATNTAGARLYRKLAALGQDAYDLAACERYAAQIDEINQLKAERGAVVLAHNYQRPEIFEVADFIGDSLELAYKAREVRDAGIIVFCGVHFMAETAKVFNPERMVLLPDLRAGCSLAESVTAEALAERKAELREILSKTIQGLPPGFRTVFVLRDVEGLSTEETAAALELSVPAVKSRLLRARLQLRERLGRVFQKRESGDGEQ